jgi:hypothetical protein
MPFNFIVDTKELDRIASGLKVKTDAIIRAMAMEDVGMTQAVIEAYPSIDTSAYLKSVYASTSMGNDMPSEPSSLRPNATRTKLPEAKEGEAYVGPSVDYAVFVEYGTYKMPARPALIPASEAVMRDYTNPGKWKMVVE